MNSKEYWKECIADALHDQEINVTADQLEYLADAIEGGFECYEMAFPAPSYKDFESHEITKLKAQIKSLEIEAKRNYDASVKLARRALNIHPDDKVSVTPDGYVERL